MCQKPVFLCHCFSGDFISDITMISFDLHFFLKLSQETWLYVLLSVRVAPPLFSYTNLKSTSVRVILRARARYGKRKVQARIIHTYIGAIVHNVNVTLEFIHSPVGCQREICLKIFQGPWCTTCAPPPYQRSLQNI